MSTFSYFSGLKPNKFNKEIKTKIVRAWKQYSPVVGESIELVLCDSFGDTIHATINKDFVARYDRIMQEGDHRLTIVVWGKHAEVLSDALRLGISRALICVVRFGKISVCQSERTVSNVYNISDITLHPDMDDVEAFLKLLQRRQITDRPCI
ncbi:hypothetical protein DY000_02048574 [Brassica cretica]|uniref:Replication protein A 70 kDa DNA-binding subunit B/D first OB fold domain-containing protein n=1 Tax=Brassica cretica TaxID=69181 RepID=A0ABQ7F627_BRACR|nr:hypothetical protein DY000_02048574 [Brassica cretica]